MSCARDMLEKKKKDFIMSLICKNIPRVDVPAVDDIRPDFKDEAFWGKWRTSCYRSPNHQHVTIILSGCFLKPNVMNIKVKLTLSVLAKTLET